MVKTVFYKIREDGVLLVRTYSTRGKQIKHKGTENIFDDGIDIGVERNGEYFPKYYQYEEVED